MDRKLFVLDTNVVLHDAGCIHNFQEHHVAIPITVLEELDQFKKGNGDLNYQAREFLRALDTLTGDLLANHGVCLGPGKGSLRVVLGPEWDQRMRAAFLRDCPDHRILNTALHLQSHEERQVVLVSKDTNLRMKAKTLGLVSQDYTSDMVESSEKLYTGKRLLELPGELINRIYENGNRTPAAEVPEIESPTPNENFILRNGSKSVLVTYCRDTSSYARIDKVRCYGIAPRNAEQSFSLSALTNSNVKLVTLAGKAGTGKTLLALAAALQCRSEYQQILLARPIVPLSNRDLGFLPGDISAKLDPYMKPLYDNLAVIRNQFDEDSPSAKRIASMLESEKLVICPLAYIRGRSLHRIFFIVDEAQNLTPHEVKTIITRAGEGTKVAFTGDIQQIDHPYLDTRSNGLSYLISRMKGQSLYAHVALDKGERSRLADLASDLL